MSEVTPLQVTGLCKSYPQFCLRDLTFRLRPGKITGFIGRNGAGKSTTLKSIFGFVHPDGGEIRLFGEKFQDNPIAAKQRIGFVPGAIDYYPGKKLSTITRITRAFYANWNEEAYAGYLSLFRLDESKKPSELSTGMKVKYALTLALSHGADLLVLDEPTSGLDPVSRDELLDIFLSLSEKGKTILFSTHITSDLERCADHILYIREGRIAADQPLEDFRGAWRQIHYIGQPPISKDHLIGIRREKEGCSALLRVQDLPAASDFPAEPVSLEEIILHLEREEHLQ